jgi:hypothetical protein
MTDKHSPTPQDYQIGGIPATMTSEEYPGLPAWWTSVRTENGQAQFARVYGDTPQEANARARMVSDALNTHAAHKEAVAELCEALLTAKACLTGVPNSLSAHQQINKVLAKHSPEKVQS